MYMLKLVLRGYGISTENRAYSAFYVAEEVFAAVALGCIFSSCVLTGVVRAFPSDIES